MDYLWIFVKENFRKKIQSKFYAMLTNVCPFRTDHTIKREVRIMNRQTICCLFFEYYKTINGFYCPFWWRERAISLSLSLSLSLFKENDTLKRFNSQHSFTDISIAWFFSSHLFNTFCILLTSFSHYLSCLHARSCLIVE